MALYLGPNLISGVFTTYHTTTFNTSDGTATAADILLGKKAYVKGSPVVGTIPTKTSSDVTISGATVSIPAGYYASDNSVTISSGTLRTPSYQLDTSTGKLTFTYGVSSAGYLGVSSPQAQFTTDFKQRASVAQSVTPSTTQVKEVKVPAGYYPTEEIITIAKATGGSQFATGTVTKSSSTVYTLPTTFTPKGFMIISNSYYADGALNFINAYALNSSTSVKAMYECNEQYTSTATETTTTQEIEVSDYLHSDWNGLYSTYPTSDKGEGLIITQDVTSDLMASYLDAEVEAITGQAVSWFTEDSDLWVGDLGWSYWVYENTTTTTTTSTIYYGAYFSSYTGTASYSSTGVTVTLRSWLPTNATYVCWG